MSSELRRRLAYAIKDDWRAFLNAELRRWGGEQKASRPREGTETAELLLFEVGKCSGKRRHKQLTEPLAEER